MLCMDHSGTFWRKYAFGADGDKLAVQLEWLRAQEGRLPLCHILRGEAEPGCCWYDMEYSAQAVSMFRYLHSNPVEKSAAILRDVLATLDRTLYTPPSLPTPPPWRNTWTKRWTETLPASGKPGACGNCASTTVCGSTARPIWACRPWNGSLTGST